MLTIFEALRRCGVYVEDSEREVQIRCLFHKAGHEVKPSARVYPDTNSYYCFTCHTSLSPVSLLAKYYNISPREMAARLHAGGEQVELPKYRARVDKALSDLILGLQTFPFDERVKLLLDWDSIFIDVAKGTSEEEVAWRIQEANLKVLNIAKQAAS